MSHCAQVWLQGRKQWVFFLTNVCELLINVVCSFDLGIKLLLFPAKSVEVTVWIYAKVTGRELSWIWGSVLRYNIFEGSSWGSWVLNRKLSLFLNRRSLWLGYTFNPFLSRLHWLPVGSKNGKWLLMAWCLWGVAAFQCDPLNWAASSKCAIDLGCFCLTGTSPPPSKRGKNKNVFKVCGPNK